MKKIEKFFKKLKSNVGSSVVMVIAAIAFIGIIVGALLAAAVQSYRLKLQELNSRDNFYYVEQALNEIYAGVGTQTVADLQNAYIYTVENMVQYDILQDRYVTKTSDEAQEMFAKEFYRLLQNNPFFTNSMTDTTALAKELASYISNDSVKLDSSRMFVEDYKNKKGENIGKVIRNLRLTRTVEYNRSSANGVFTQSITTDIVIGDPDFKVSFDAINSQDPNIFKYALVADMGVEVDQPTVPLTIAGNIYAASDFYNKQYNESTWDKAVSDTSKKYTSDISYKVKDGEDEVELKDLYTHGSVTSKSALDDSSFSYYNQYATLASKNEVAGFNDKYDGLTSRSRYSGLYVDGSQVSVLADSIIVPGTIAVMDKGSLSIYGKSGTQTAKAEVWMDNLVLEGYSTVKDKQLTDGTVVKEYEGSEAILKADLFVKDDTELNAAGSELQLSGDYYGYGDSTEKDERVFTPVVDKKDFQIDVINDGKTTTENRGHYNSSAIIVNGEQSTLNLAQARTLFLAGRTYIELSKDVTTVDGTITETQTVDGKQQDVTVATVKDTYTYHPVDYDPELPADQKVPDNKTTTIRDYKTGESISLKSNQLAYIPVLFNGIPTLAKNKQGQSLGYYLAELKPALKGSVLFETYFPEAVFDGKVPCVLQEISGKKYYYYDFKTAYDMVSNRVYSSGSAMDPYAANPNTATITYTEWLNRYPSAQYFAAGFIADYDNELEKHRAYVEWEKNPVGTAPADSLIAEHLVDIGDYKDFDAGNIVLPDAENNPDVSIYSSGAITTKTDTTFSIVRADNTNVLQSLLVSTDPNYAELKKMNFGNTWSTSADATGKEAKYASVYQFCNDLEMEYDIMKWNLGHFSDNPALSDEVLANNQIEKDYLKAVVNDSRFGDASITPINKFLDMSKIKSGTFIAPNGVNPPKVEDENGKEITPSILNLASGYSVWVSNYDVTVQARPEDKGAVRGIVVTKGDVYFDSTTENGVKDFEGLIIAGGKIYVAGNVNMIAANIEICRAVLHECILTNDDNCKFLLELFRGYEPSAQTETSTSTDAKSIDTIDYTDIVSFDNWMKNVE